MPHIRQALKQTISLLLLAAEVFTISWEYYREYKHHPTLQLFYANTIFVALFLFHFHTICDFYWNSYAYIGLSAFAITHLIQNKLSKERQNWEYLLFKIIIVCIVAVVGLKIEGFEHFLSNSWEDIIVLPSAIIIILHAWVVINTLFEGINSYYFYHNIKQPLAQRLSAFAAITFLFCTYYLIIMRLFVPKEVC